MKSNYNDIMDIILTITQDEEISKSIAISGSIVPYIIANKESDEFHSDFYILVKSKMMNKIREKMKKLSKEYQFDMVSDSYKITKSDFGFKMKYENTVVGFFPYSLIDNKLTIKTFSVNDEEKEIKLKIKVVPDVAKSSVIRLVNFAKDKTLRIMSPEFVLADKEMREKQPGNPTETTMKLLNKICDESILDVVRKSVSKAEVKITSRKITNDNFILTIVLAVLLIILIIIAYICFKK